MRKKRTRIKFQRVAVEYFQSLIRKVRAQKTCQARVFLDCKNVRAFLKDEAGQGA